MMRLIFIAAPVLICMGIYSLYLNAFSSEKPTTVSLSNLIRKTPLNRNLEIVGAYVKASDIGEYRKTKRGQIVESYYIIPLRETERDISAIPPRVVVKLTDKQMKDVKAIDSIFASSIQGLRVTQFEISGKVKEYLAEKYGKEASKNIQVIDYLRKPEGILIGIIQLLFGAILAAIWYFVVSRCPGQ